MCSPFGFVVIHKPAGLTSHDCVNRLRKVFQLKRVGHGGTLDPAVTGILPIALGNATRLLPYLPQKKTYRGVIQLGKRSTTDDLEGEILSCAMWPKLERSSLEQYLDKFRGCIEQVPPQVSSIHVKGERAYRRVKRGEVVTLPSRKITVFELQLIDWNQFLGELEITVHCSSGTYIRALARDLGEAIGCGGCLSSLRRTAALGFDETQAISLPEKKGDTYEDRPHVLSPLQALNHLPRLQFSTEQELLHWRQGRTLLLAKDRYQPSLTPPLSIKEEDNNTIVVLDLSGEIAGIGSWVESTSLKPKVVFNALG